MKNNSTSLITRDPAILGGKPIIKGTRMSVEVTLELLAGGMEIREILKEYPFLTRQQVQAAIDYAAKAVDAKNSRRLDKFKLVKHLPIPHEIPSRR